MKSRVPISKRLIVSNAAVGLLTFALNATVLVWVVQYLLRHITPEEYALLPLVMALMQFMPLLTVFLTAGLGRFVTEAHARGDDERITQIATSMTPVLLVATLPVAALAALAIWRVDLILAVDPQRVGEARLMIALLFASTCVSLPLAVFGTGLYAHQKFAWQNGIALGVSAVRVGLMFGLLLGLGPRVIWVVVATVTANTLGLFAQRWLSLRIMPSLRPRRGAFRWAVVREVTGFGAWSTVGQASGSIREASDPIVLSHLATPVDVNAFHVGSTIDRQIRNFLQGLMNLLGPAMIAMHASQQHGRLANAYLRASRIGMWGILAVGTPLAIYRHEILSLYLKDQYPTYREAATVLLLLTLAYPFYASVMLLSRVAQAQGDVGSVTRWSVTFQVLNLVLTLVLVGSFGMGATGSAAASLVAMASYRIFAMFFMAPQLVDASPARQMRETMVPGLLPALGAVAVAYTIRHFWPPSTALAVVVQCLLVLAPYAALVWACMSNADRADLAKAMARLKSS